MNTNLVILNTNLSQASRGDNKSSQLGHPQSHPQGHYDPWVSPKGFLWLGGGMLLLPKLFRGGPCHHWIHLPPVSSE